MLVVVKAAVSRMAKKAPGAAVVNVDNALFGRHFAEGDVYATIVDGLDRMAEACNDVWRSGGVGERLLYARAES